MNYSEKLKDPRWQKKRLEILNRDEFTCQCCGDTTTTLHVHHEDYEEGKEPWDVHEYLLTTLCEDCHRVKHILKTGREAFLFECLLTRMKAGGEDIKRFVKFIIKMEDSGENYYL